MTDTGLINQLEAAAAAIESGKLVVYPTETVYGLGANALEHAAIERVFEAKERDRDKPLSMAVARVEQVSKYTTLTATEIAVMQEFLPGPVTVVVSASDQIPAALTGGRDRVGIRIPDNEIALALLDRTPPLTATSANVSGRPSARKVGDLDAEIQHASAVVVDGGETHGGGSTVVDVEQEIIHREGPLAEEITEWLASHEDR